MTTPLAEAITRIRLEVESKNTELAALQRQQQAEINQQIASVVTAEEERHAAQVAASVAQFHAVAVPELREWSTKLAQEAGELRTLRDQIDACMAELVSRGAALNVQSQNFVEAVARTRLQCLDTAQLDGDTAKDLVGHTCGELEVDAIRFTMPAWINLLQKSQGQPTIASTIPNSLYNYARICAGDVIKRRKR